MKLHTVLPLLVLSACFSAADDAAEPESAATARCTSSHPTPDVDAVLADPAPALATAHERLAELTLVSFPTDLDFDPGKPAEVKRSTKAFRASLGQLTAASRRAEDAYKAAGPAGCEGVRIVRLWVAHTVETAPIPELGESEFSEDMTRAYCDALREQGTPLRARLPTCTAN